MPEYKITIGMKVKVRQTSKITIIGEVAAISDGEMKIRVSYPAPWGGQTSGWFNASSVVPVPPVKEYPFSK